VGSVADAEAGAVSVRASTTASGGTGSSDDSNWMSEHLNVHPRAVMEKLHFYRCGGQAVFEVFQYAAAGRRVEQPRNSDVGGHHVAFYVDDLDTAVAYLRDRGVQLCGEPTASSGPSQGQRWIYFLSPWGMQFELVSYPNGKAFDRMTSGPGELASPSSLTSRTASRRTTTSVTSSTWTGSFTC